MAALNALVIDSDDLTQVLTDRSNNITILDVRTAEAYDEAHIPGAHRLEPALLNRAQPPQGGLLPESKAIAEWAAEQGLTSQSTVVVYDEGKSTAAARALWVLNVFGFNEVHWLNGGFYHWQQNGGDVTTDIPALPEKTDRQKLLIDRNLVLTLEEVSDSLARPRPENPKRQAVDARSAAEFNGSDVRSARGGHLPGAVHYDWRDMFAADGKLKPDEDLRKAFNVRALHKDEPVLVYCQTHQRSAVTYVVLRHLGFVDVAALDGAWSTWGNDPSTPIET